MAEDDRRVDVTFLNIFRTGKADTYAVRYAIDAPQAGHELGDAVIQLKPEDQGGILATVWPHASRNGNPESGYRYTRDIVDAFLRQWRGEVESRPYTFMRIDIVGHSRITREHPMREAEQTLDAFYSLVDDIVRRSGGEIFSWQGDGGLIVFEGEGREEDSVACGIVLIEEIKSFNQDGDRNQLIPFNVSLDVRMAIHSGRARPRPNKGLVHSRDINLVSHMEADLSCPGYITMSGRTFSELTSTTQELFTQPLPIHHEGQDIYTDAPADVYTEFYANRPDHLLWEAESHLTEELGRSRELLLQALMEMETAVIEMGAASEEYRGVLERRIVRTLSHPFFSDSDLLDTMTEDGIGDRLPEAVGLEWDDTYVDASFENVAGVLELLALAQELLRGDEVVDQTAERIRRGETSDPMQFTKEHEGRRHYVHTRKRKDGRYDVQIVDPLSEYTQGFFQVYAIDAAAAAERVWVEQISGLEAV